MGYEKLYACERNFLAHYLDIIENSSLSDADLKIAAQFGKSESEDDDDIEDIYSEQGDEATIKVSGMLTQAKLPFIAKLFGIEGTSYPSIQSAIAKASDNPIIKRLKLIVNSPGGEATSGVDAVWQALHAWGKNCRAENHALMASAAYYLSSACDSITAMTPMCEQGGIGIIAAGVDDSEAMKRDGKKHITLTSSNAPKKNMGFDSKEGRENLYERMNALEGMFLSRVAEGRRLPIDTIKAWQGAVMMAEHPRDSDAFGSPSALLAHMIDGIAPSVPDTASRKTPGGQLLASSNGRRHMTLSEFLASDPAAKQEYDAAITKARQEGVASFDGRIKAAQPFLALKATKDGYDQAEVDSIFKAAIDVVMGIEEPAGLRSFVRMVDMTKEKRKQAAAVAETEKIGDTPPLAASTDADLLAKAAALKIDVAKVQVYAKANAIDERECLKAEIERIELQAKDNALIGAGGK